jgi:hypothetical protein
MSNVRDIIVTRVAMFWSDVDAAVMRTEVLFELNHRYNKHTSTTGSTKRQRQVKAAAVAEGGNQI